MGIAQAMQLALTLVAADPERLPEARRIAEAIADAGRVKEPRALGPGAADLSVEGELDGVRRAVGAALDEEPVDWCVQPWAGRKKRLLVADMDSTIIGCECLDELADFAGVKAEVAAVTERAMRGEIAFEPALRERVARLQGLPLSVLEQCYAERVRLNPGARTLVRTMAASGARTVLVSGGFGFFTERVAEAAGFAAQRANRLLDDGARLTGKVAEPILGREAKLEALREEAERLGAGLEATMAVGDGANDLAMIEAAGLGVAYRAKPAVAAQAAAKVEHGDLTALLYFQGYRQAEFVDG